MSCHGLTSIYKTYYQAIHVASSASMVQSSSAASQTTRSRRPQFYILSLRVRVPHKDPVTNEVVQITMSNHVAANSLLDERSDSGLPVNLGTGAAAPGSPHYSTDLSSSEPVSLLSLATMATNRAGCGGDSQGDRVFGRAHSTNHTMVTDATMSLLSTAAAMKTRDQFISKSASAGAIDRSPTKRDRETAPKICLAVTDTYDEYFEVEIEYDEMCEIRRQMGFNHDSMTWTSFMEHLHRAITNAKSQTRDVRASDLRDEISEEPSLVLEFEDESEDVLHIFLSCCQNQTGTSNQPKQQRMNFKFSVYARRHDIQEQMSALLFDMSCFTCSLHYQRMNGKSAMFS